MKKKIPLIIAVFLLLQSVGYFIVFEIRQAIIHEEVKEKIEKSVDDCDLVIFKIPVNMRSDKRSDLQRINNKEFKHHGKMYDIVREKQINDTIWYYCLSDEKETSLFMNLDRIIKQQQDNNPNHKNQQKQQDRYFSLMYDIESYSFHHFSALKKVIQYNYTAYFVFSSPETKKPPPKYQPA